MILYAYSFAALNVGNSLVQAVGFEEQLAAIQQARSKDEPESLYRKEHMRLWTKLRPYVRVLCGYLSLVA